MFLLKSSVVIFGNYSDILLFSAALLFVGVNCLDSDSLSVEVCRAKNTIMSLLSYSVSY